MAQKRAFLRRFIAEILGYRSAPKRALVFREYIAEIQGYRSAQKRVPTDKCISSYDAIKLAPSQFLQKMCERNAIFSFFFGALDADLAC